MGGRSRSNQISVSFGCAKAVDTGPANSAKAAATRQIREWWTAVESRRLSLDGPVVTQLCDLFRVVAKIVEYLRIVFAQLRPDPFRSAGCL